MALSERNPDRYRRLSLPYESKKIADERVTEFLEGVAALRVEKKIPDASIVLSWTFIKPDGVESAAQAMHFHMGDTTKAPLLLASAFRGCDPARAAFRNEEGEEGDEEAAPENKPSEPAEAQSARPAAPKGGQG